MPAVGTADPLTDVEEGDGKGSDVIGLDGLASPSITGDEALED